MILLEHAMVGLLGAESREAPSHVRMDTDAKGAPGKATHGTRTRDLSFTKAPLCQLS